MRILLILISLTVGFSESVRCEDSGSDNIITVDFEAVKKGWHHGADIKNYYPIVEIHTMQKWSYFWKDLTSDQLPPSEAPNIDFKNWFIVAVFDLEKPNSCYQFDIKNLYQDVSLPNSISYVSLDYRLPGLSATCLDAGSKNYEIVKIKRR